MKNIFLPETVTELTSRINALTPNTKPDWGKMSADQMLAHCNVTYEMSFEDIHKKPNFFAKILLKAFVKNAVVSEKPYPKNSRTAPQFIITGTKDFEKEKSRLLGYLNKTVELGEKHFDGLESHSFGPLTIQEWNNTFYKHLDHHLVQFGV